MRDLGPVPVTSERSTPISRASFLTDGPACALAKPSSLKIGAGRGLAGTDTATGTGAAAAVGGASGTAAGGSAGAAGAAATAAFGSGARASERTVTSRSPGDTLLDFATCTLSITPAAVEGTSIAAFSVSSVTNGASVSMTSPGLTSTSMTVTSLKSPMSGTRTSICR